MFDDSQYRKARIERLLQELEYEITRGMMNREIEETMGYRFVVPVSNVLKNGVVACQFSTRPVLGASIGPDFKRGLQIVRAADASRAD
jgi:hypothetical protein